METPACQITAHPGWRPTEHGIELFDVSAVTVSRYRYRGNQIPNPWTATTTSTAAYPTPRTCGEPDAQEWARPVRRAGRGNGPAERLAPRLAPTQHLMGEPGEAPVS